MAKRTLGGDRVGSGNRMKQELHNYGRSNHNLSCARITSAAPGVLYPLYTTMGLTGDTFDIDLKAFCRTLPTEGPMFGAFKLQVDVFSADARLYQAILHNNTTEIGMDMDKVLFPKIKLATRSKWVYDETTGKYKWKKQLSKSSLMYYLGVSGIASHIPTNNLSQLPLSRKFNAIPMLAYYDIFKNYYANKQEENAYVIAGKNETIGTVTGNIQSAYFAEQGNIGPEIFDEIPFADITVGFTVSPNTTPYIFIEGTNLIAKTDNGVIPTIRIARASSETPSSSWAYQGNYSLIINNKTKNGIIFEYIGTDTTTDVFRIISTPQQGYLEDTNTSIKLNAFPLKNIDEMRKRLLTSWDLGEEIVIDNTEDLLPYSTLTKVIDTEKNNGESVNIYPMQGLVVKCYQSDMFNNWLDSEWVAKITEYSKVNVTNGSFTMDALNMAKKMYNHYNRVAITGGTYDDWQLAAYGEENYGKSEKPVYHGGMSSEVIFDEVISSVQSTDSNGDVQPLGTLGGRGSLKGNRGGHVIIKCKEATVIMVMVSLTPRLTYSQGNAWYLTELDSMDDLHKPEFDRIGFQDLIQEKLAWWSAAVNPSSGQLSRLSVGKQPAWIDYQTDVDKCYGDFAEEDGKGYMVLQRLYDYDQETRGVADITTYIDPSKYNYPFAVNDLTAQNFWLFLNLDIKARRKMSAKQIPNF